MKPMLFYLILFHVSLMTRFVSIALSSFNFGYGSLTCLLFEFKLMFIPFVLKSIVYMWINKLMLRSLSTEVELLLQKILDA